MAQFPKSIATGSAGVAAAKAKQGGGGKFTSNFFWKDGDKRYIQFITDWEGIPTLPMYTVKQPGVKWMKDFVDPRAWHGEDADNALADEGWEPQLKQVAVAVEVVPVMGTKNGRKVPVSWKPATRTFKRKSGEEVTVPNVGVIINTPTLYVHVENYFEDNGTILDTVFSITRNGGDQNTSYTVSSMKGEIADITDEIAAEIDLTEYLQGLADSAGIRELVESAPEGFEFNFSKRDKGGSKSKAKKVEAVEDVDDDGEDWEDNEDDGDVDDAAAARKSKFDAMRANMN